jgi:hypothetical protein
MSEADERRRPSGHAYMEHIPNPVGISTLAIFGLILAHSSVTTSKNSSDLVSYAISKAPPKHRQPNNKKNQHTEKIGSENLTLEDDRAQKIASRIQNTRTTCFVTDYTTLIKKLGNREKIVPQIHDREKIVPQTERNTPKSHRLTHLHRAH